VRRWNSFYVIRAATSEVSPTDNGSKTHSARELEVLDLLVQGCYYLEISDRLEISYATVHTHVRHIYKKFQVHSRGQAVAKFLNHRMA
jgi:DNA-binding CsgD family transcriptional regulator